MTITSSEMAARHVFTLAAAATINMATTAAEWSSCGEEHDRERALYSECVAQRCGFFQKEAFLSAADYSRLRAGVTKLAERHGGVFTALDLHRQNGGKSEC